MTLEQPSLELPFDKSLSSSKSCAPAWSHMCCFLSHLQELRAACMGHAQLLIDGVEEALNFQVMKMECALGGHCCRSCWRTLEAIERQDVLLSLVDKLLDAFLLIERTKCSVCHHQSCQILLKRCSTEGRQLLSQYLLHDIFLHALSTHLRSFLHLAQEQGILDRDAVGSHIFIILHMTNSLHHVMDTLFRLFEAIASDN
mmetsp:Transcript_69231/g.122462  ORF Transcript_69231/g.122462 Transcript_69231/m.122462 type:complete len:200 (-) Transcript_69231:537-1136(-)